MEKENEVRNEEPREPLREEVLRLLKVIDDEIIRSERSKRSIERDLGMGQGYLGSVLSGRITLKVSHVWRLGEALGIEPLLLFYRSASRKSQTQFLHHLGILLPEDADPEMPESPVTRSEVEQIVHVILAEELESGEWTKHLGLKGSKPSEPPEPSEEPRSD